MKSKDISLFSLVHDYLKIYLPKQRSVSPNIIRSYRKALEELLDYVKDCKQISLGEVTFDHLTTDMILSFLEYLELEKGCSVPTRNIRFAAIRAFMVYAADRDLTLVANLNKLKKVPFKKSETTIAVDYMSMAAITAIIEQPDTSTLKGLRDQFLMILLYDTGAQVQEILNIKLCDLQLGCLPKVRRCICQEVPEKVHPHLFRHPYVKPTTKNFYLVFPINYTSIKSLFPQLHFEQSVCKFSITVSLPFAHGLM